MSRVFEINWKIVEDELLYWNKIKNYPVWKKWFLKSKNVLNTVHPDWKCKVNTQSPWEVWQYCFIQVLIDSFGYFGESNEQELEVRISRNNTNKSNHNHARHSSTEGKTNQEDHNNVGIMILNLKIRRSNGVIHVLLYLMFLGQTLIHLLHQVVIERHVGMWTDGHNKPCEPQLITDVDIPIVFWHLVICELGCVHFHCVAIEQLWYDHLELYSEQVRLKQESYHYCCYDVDDH